jgi:oligopeptide transport system permease protein
MNELNPDLFRPIDRTKIPPAEVTAPGLTFWQDVWRRFKKNRSAYIALWLLGLLFLMALIGPNLNEHTYYETTLEKKNLPPSATYWFGSDDLGRDLFTRCWQGARISLFIGIIAATLDVAIGILWGGVAALAGGRVDELMMRFADILYGLPYLLVVIMLMVVLGAGLIPIIIAMTITGWINMARIVRGQVLQLKNQEYVQASILLGASSWRILFRHLIPNAMAPIIVTMTLTIPAAIFVEAFLSFLGLGVQAPVASWGTMSADGLPAMKYYPWRLFFPVFFISLTMLAFNLIGDGLRDAFDPRLRK